MSDIDAIRAYIGSAVPPSDDDLTALLAELGTVDAVAQRILQGRLADRLTTPSEYQLDGDLKVKWDLSRLESEVDDLKAKTGASPRQGLLYRTDRER